MVTIRMKRESEHADEDVVMPTKWRGKAKRVVVEKVVSLKQYRCDLLEEFNVFVGPEQGPFTGSKAFLTKRSTVLKTLVTEDQTVGSPKKIFLRDVPVDVFKLYLVWLYGHKFDVERNIGEWRNDNSFAWHVF